MDFKEYQEKAWQTAIYPNKGNNFIYPTLGLAGESGEVCEKIKKVIRDDNGIISEEKKLLIKKEISDVLWYCAALSTELGFDLGNIAEENIKKLFDRKERNQLHGSGDNR